MFALREMPPAAGWPFRGEMPMVCVVILLMHSADLSIHSEWGTQRCQAVPLLKFQCRALFP